MPEFEDLVITFTYAGKPRTYYLADLLSLKDNEYAVFLSQDPEMTEAIFLRVEGDILQDIADEDEYKKIKNYWEKLDKYLPQEESNEI